jgi:RimJ/RimL family protein N-acetyltransferase
MVYAVTPITNEASIALFESLHFKNSGTLRHWVLQKGQFQDAYLFQLVQA